MEQKSIFSIAIFGFESDTLFSYRKSVAKSKITQLGMENFVQVLMEWDLKCCKTNVMTTLKISLKLIADHMVMSELHLFCAKLSAAIHLNGNKLDITLKMIMHCTQCQVRTRG